MNYLRAIWLTLRIVRRPWWDADEPFCNISLPRAWEISARIWLGKKNIRDVESERDNWKERARLWEARATRATQRVVDLTRSVTAYRLILEDGKEDQWAVREGNPDSGRPMELTAWVKDAEAALKEPWPIVTASDLRAFSKRRAVIEELRRLADEADQVYADPPKKAMIPTDFLRERAAHLDRYVL